MNSFVIILASIVAAISAYPVHENYHGPSNYKFNYGVSDPHTGDHKEQYEVRHGHVVHGSYSLAEPDGTHRIVEYSSGPHSGFNAVVKKIGKSIHPPTYHHGHNIYNSGAGQLHGYHGHWDAHSHVGTTHWGHY